jgi:virulence-associated protein VapD
LIKVLKEQNQTYRSIADKLNESGFKTSKGNKFFANSVKQLQTMFDSENLSK